MAIEYESALFQTRSWYEPFFGHLEFNESTHAAKMNVDVLGLGKGFHPFSIEMPSNVQAALARLYDSIPDAHPGLPAADWLRTVKLGVNYVTRNIYGLLHCTGPKEWLDVEYPKFWWYPFARSLLRAAVDSARVRENISSEPIDGRIWTAKTFLPHGISKSLQDEYGGAWSDEVAGGKFIPWRHLCGQHEELLFGGERPLAKVAPMKQQR